VSVAPALPVERQSLKPARLHAPSASSAKVHLGSLDLARGLAALAVALFHFTNNGWLPKGHWLASIGWYGHLGVRAFFVMSGFVVPFAMWRGGYTGRGFFSFMGRRLARLYPPYAVSVGIMALLGTHVSSRALAAHALYLNDLLGLPWMIEVYWTLAIEVQFYIVVALAWRVVAIGRSWPFVALAVATLATTFLPCPSRSLLHFATSFLLGIAAFRWHSDIGTRWANIAAATAAVIAIWYKDGTAAACASLLPLLLLATPMRVPRWGRFLGDVSYSLYLYHLVTGGALLFALQALPLSNNLRTPLVFIALGVSVFAAWLGFRWIEAPAIQWAKRFTYRPQVTAPTLPSPAKLARTP
jgi:peptidoglycan/LPS O-acetylase OafA/YrhL